MTRTVDRNCNACVKMIYVRENIPLKLTEIIISIEGIFIELNLSKKG